MFTKVFLLCSAVILTEVIANPILQTLAPQCQLCPQNGPRNQYNPLSLLLQPNNIQSYLQPLLGQNGMNYQPAGNTYPNQAPCQTNQQVNPDLFNKILSNPTLKSILDPNTRLYNQNGAEIQRNAPCNNAMPNVINNYIIVPPEFLLDDARCVLKEDKRPERNNANQVEGRKRTDNSRNGSNKSRNKKKYETVQAGGSESEADRLRENKDRRSSRKSNKKPDIKVKVLNENATINEPYQIEAPKLAKVEVDKFVETENITTVDSINKEKITTTPIIESKLEDVISTDYTTEQNLQECVTSTTPISEKSKSESVRPQDIRNRERRRKSRRRNKNNNNTNNNNNVKANVIKNNVKNNREEAAIQDFHRKFPNIPEEVVRHLLSYMKRQLEKQQLGAPAYYYPQHPITYEQLYKPQESNTNSNNKEKKKKTRHNRTRNNRRRKKPKPQEKILDTETLPTTTIDEEITTTPATIDITIVETVPTEDVTESTIKTTTPIVDNKEEDLHGIASTEKSEDNIKYDNNHAPLGHEDVVPVIYMNDLIDEYYPDFKNDNQYDSDEDYPFRFLHDDRYHYTTDKNLELEELNRERRKYDSKPADYVFRNPENRYVFRLRRKRPNTRLLTKSRTENLTERPRFKVTINNNERLLPITTIKPKFMIVPTTLKDIEIATDLPETITENEVIEFRTPPTLETIDFETKPISKDKINFDFPDKFSTFSDVKSPQYNIKEKGGNNNVKPKVDDEIETVFARSKVVTYGIPSSEEYSSSNERDTLIKRDEDISQFTDDGKTVVFAKSISDVFW